MGHVGGLLSTLNLALIHFFTVIWIYSHIWSNAVDRQWIKENIEEKRFPFDRNCGAIKKAFQFVN